MEDDLEDDPTITPASSQKKSKTNVDKPRNDAFAVKMAYLTVLVCSSHSPLFVIWDMGANLPYLQWMNKNTNNNAVC